MVIADHQTKGRGRSNRDWVTKPGSALAISIILLPTKQERKFFHYLTALGAIAVGDALIKHFNFQVEIKWPNDVLIQRKKVCGILTENSWSGDQIEAVVIGIGINVACSSVPPRNSLAFPGTSIEHELGRAVNRMEVLQMVINSFFDWRKSIARPEFFDFWQEHLAYRGEPVRIIEDGKTVAAGRLLGLSRSGELELLSENDAKITVMTGDLHLRPIG